MLARGDSRDANHKAEASTQDGRLHTGHYLLVVKGEWGIEFVGTGEVGD